jgi:hypothetical protein
MFNESISLPKSEVCIQLSINETNVTQLNPNSEKHIEIFIGLIKNQNPELQTSPVSLPILFQVIHLYLAALDFFETQSFQQENNNNNNFNYNNNENFGNSLSTQNPQFSQFHHHHHQSSIPDFITQADESTLLALNNLDYNINLKTSNFTVDDLRQRFGLAIADIFSLQAVQRMPSLTGNSTQENIEIDRVLQVSKDEVCFQFRLDLYPFTKNQNKIIAITAFPADLSGNTEFNETEKWRGGFKTPKRPPCPCLIHGHLWSLNGT